MSSHWVRLARVIPLMGSRVMGAGVTGGLTVYVARTEGSEFSGRFFYFLSTLAILSVLTRLGADSYLSAQIAPRASGGPTETNRHLVAVIIAVGSLVLLVGGVLAAFRLIFGDQTSELLGGVPVHVLVLAVLGLNMIWIAGGYARAVGKAALSIFIETGLLSLWLFGVLEVSRSADLDADPGRVALAISLLLPLVALFLLPVFYGGRKHWANRSDIRSALSGVIGFGAVTVTNAVVILVPLQVLGWADREAEAGVYNAALRVSMLVGAFGVVLRSIVVRDVVRGVDEASRAKDVQRAGVMAVPWLVLSVAIALCGSQLERLFGRGFEDLSSILLVMLVAQCVHVSGNFIETRAVLWGGRRLLNITSATTLVTALVVTPPLVATFGLQGAAWSFAVTVLVSRTQLVLLYLRAERPASGAQARHRLSKERTPDEVH